MSIEKVAELYERIDNESAYALMFAMSYGQDDGAHHKMWVIDQMVRAITGDAYEAMIKFYEEDGKYEWDTGVAP